MYVYLSVLPNKKLEMTELLKVKLQAFLGFTQGDMKAKFKTKSSLAGRSLAFNNLVETEHLCKDFQDLPTKRQEELSYQLMDALDVPYQPRDGPLPNKIFSCLQLVDCANSTLTKELINSTAAEEFMLPRDFPDKPIATALRSDPRRVFVQIPCLHCEGWIDKLGPLPNISISLAAWWAQAHGLPKKRQFRTDYQFSVVLPSVSQAHALQGLTLNCNLMQRRPANSAKSLKTTRNLVEQSFAVLVLQEIVHWKWVLRHSDMAIRDWLDSNIVDTGFPVRLPHLESIRDRWQLVFHNKELSRSITVLLRSKGLEAGKLLLKSLRQTQQALRADKLLRSEEEGFKQAFKAFFHKKVVQELMASTGLFGAFDQYHTGFDKTAPI